MKDCNVYSKNGKPFIVFENPTAAELYNKKHGGELCSILFMNRKDCSDYVKLHKSDVPSFDQQKKLLHSWYKKYKVGMVKWESIPVDIQELLKKYYGVF